MDYLFAPSLEVTHGSGAVTFPSGVTCDTGSTSPVVESLLLTGGFFLFLCLSHFFCPYSFPFD